MRFQVSDPLRAVPFSLPRWHKGPLLGGKKRIMPTSSVAGIFAYHKYIFSASSSHEIVKT